MKHHLRLLLIGISAFFTVDFDLMVFESTLATVGIFGEASVSVDSKRLRFIPLFVNVDIRSKLCAPTTFCGKTFADEFDDECLLLK